MTKPDTSKKASGKTAKPPKAPKTAVKTFDREAEEARLVKKYSKQDIVKGSLRDAGEVPEFGQKRTIEIVCQGDHKTKRRIATSDLHQVMYSEEWIKKVRLERRKESRGGKKSTKRVAKTTKVAKAPDADKAPRKGGRPRKNATAATV